MTRILLACLAVLNVEIHIWSCWSMSVKGALVSLFHHTSYAGDLAVGYQWMMHITTESLPWLSGHQLGCLVTDVLLNHMIKLRLPFLLMYHDISVYDQYWLDSLVWKLSVNHSIHVLGWVLKWVHLIRAPNSVATNRFQSCVRQPSS